MTSFISKLKWISNSPLIRILGGALWLILSYSLLAKFAVDKSTGLPSPLISLIITAGILLVYTLIYSQWEKRSILELSIRKLSIGFLYGFIVAFAIIGLFVLILFFTGTIHFEGNLPLINLINTFCILLVLATFEELFFRAVVFRIVNESIGFIWAISISSILFAFAHISNAHFNIVAFLNLLVFSAITAFLFLKFNSLWMPIFAHVGWNYAQTFFGMNVSGSQSIEKFFITKTEGAEWLSGGSFGPEGSYILLALLLGTLLWFIKDYRTNKYIIA